jgi:hypothetical protein
VSIRQFPAGQLIPTGVIEEEFMLMAYGAYLIRCWWNGEAVCRVEIRHIQTGERVVVRSTAAALEVIDGDWPEGHGSVEEGPGGQGGAEAEDED